MTVIFQIEAMSELDEISQWLSKRKIVIEKQPSKKVGASRKALPAFPLGKSRKEGIRRMLQFVRTNELPKVTKIEIPTREERNER